MMHYAPNYICANVSAVKKPARAARSLQRRRMLEVLEQFRVIVKSIRRHYQDVERRAGLTGAQLWALAQIAEQPGAKVGELARALEALGLVRRERRGRDQRHVRLFPTSKGLQLLKGAPRPLIGVLQQALSELSAARLRALHAELAHVLALMKGRSVAA